MIYSMGLTIYSPSRCIDIPYSGFARLRRMVAHLVSDEVGRHYDALYTSHGAWNRGWQIQYEEVTEQLIEEYGKRWEWVFDFLYAPDGDGKLRYGKCRKLLELTSELSDEEVIGYQRRENPATVGAFKEVLRDCVSSRRQMRWY